MRDARDGAGTGVRGVNGGELGSATVVDRDVVRFLFAVLALVALGSGGVAACAGIDDPDGGPNAPCTRTSHCGGGLVCIEGVCREPDGGAAPDASGSDGSADSDADAAPID